MLQIHGNLELKTKDKEEIAEIAFNLKKEIQEAINRVGGGGVIKYYTLNVIVME